MIGSLVIFGNGLLALFFLSENDMPKFYLHVAIMVIVAVFSPTLPEDTE